MIGPETSTHDDNGSHSRPSTLIISKLLFDQNKRMRNRNRINICGIPHMGDTDRNSYYFLYP
uniref:ORF61d n=1 Tax=Pinus koraiensis TaxID=88728 RepID=Q85WU4_PINKO|nr:ORF61d [Pinus koraiensis]AAO74125.2 ORF61d [Pinus koraiensis]